MQKKFDLVIVGGGAAGMLAGCLAAEAGSNVLIIERLQQGGRKILVSGGGRCNLTKLQNPAEMIRAYYNKYIFVRNAIYNFSAEDLITFFAAHGLRTVVEKEGGVYPASNKAADVYMVLLESFVSSGGSMHTGETADEIICAGGAVTGLRCGNKVYLTDKVLLAAGGKGKSELGADGSGFKLAQKAGHSIVEPVSGLTGIRVSSQICAKLAGTVVKGCMLKVGGRKQLCCFGDILFTHKGLSGPAVLNISREVSREYRKSSQVILHICWGKERSFWEKELAAARVQNGSQNIENLLKKFFSGKFVIFLLDNCGIDHKTKIAELKKKHKLILVESIVDCKITISALEPLAKAMVCSGGVKTAEISSNTLESKLVRGLFFSGEVIDIDGECGGYNLQWAFSSAALAVRSILKSDC